MSTGNSTPLAEKIRSSLQSNALKSYGAMLQNLDESSASTQYLTPDTIFSVAASASGLTQKDAAACKSKFQKRFGSEPGDELTPELMMARVLKVMDKPMRNLTMELMPEGLKDRVQKTHQREIASNTNDAYKMAL